MRPRFSNFDLLRLFLALEVVLGHCNAFTGYGLKWWPVNPVPAFVCLSGFLIPGSFEGSRNWQHFGWKRVLRVYPAFLVSLVLVVSTVGFVALPGTLACYLTAGLVAVAGCANGALWSLMLEEVLYASHVVSRLKKLWSAEGALVCCLLCLAGSFWLHQTGGFKDINNVDRIVRAAAAYFAGNLLYFNRAKLERVSGLAAAALLVGACLLGRYVVGGESTYFAVVIGLTAVLSVVAAYRLPQLPFKIPDLSYGLYIYHIPILAAVVAAGQRGLGAAVTTVALTFLASVVSWYLVEKPALRLKDWTPGRSSVRVNEA